MGDSGGLQQAKLVLLGDMGAGKSSLVLRFVKGQFFDYQVDTWGFAAHRGSMQSHSWHANVAIAYWTIISGIYTCRSRRLEQHSSPKPCQSRM